MRPVPMHDRPLAALLVLLLASFAAEPARAQVGEWSNLGGNAQRNGATAVFGPTAADPLWSNTADPSIIAWHVASGDGAIVTVRETGFPSSSGPFDEIVAYDEDTGSERWRATVPYGGDPSLEWIAWVGGVRDGRVIAGRGGSGRETPLYAFDVQTGALVWSTVDVVGASGYDGIVFTADGDVIAADFDQVFRFDGATGQTEWIAPRTCSVSGACGPALYQNAVYVDEVGPGGQVITRIDAATGAKLYSSPVMSGTTAQNTPFVSRDGRFVYFARTQNNPATDELYAFRDTGTQFVSVWSRAVRWTTSHEHGIGPDGTIYTFLPGDEFVGLAPATGNVVYSAGVLAPVGGSPRTAIAIDGTVYLSNGWASSPATDGRLWAFAPDLSTQLFELTLDRQNQGGPALCDQGQLVVADRQGVHAYRHPGPAASCAPRLGSGVNTAVLTCVQPAELYGALELALNVDVATAATVVMVAAPLAPVPFGGGELLVNPTVQVALTTQPPTSGGLHTFAIGGAPGLLGLSASAQGARVQLTGPVTTVELSNAIDFAIGY